MQQKIRPMKSTMQILRRGIWWAREESLDTSFQKIIRQLPYVLICQLKQKTATFSNMDSFKDTYLSSQASSEERTKT